MFAKRNLRAKYIIEGAAGLVPRIGTGGLADHIAELGYTQTYAFVTEVGSREYNAQTMGPARCFNVSISLNRNCLQTVACGKSKSVTCIAS